MIPWINVFGLNDEAAFTTELHRENLTAFHGVNPDFQKNLARI